MGELSQLVLLASIVASCISYSIDSTKTMPVLEPPVEPSESDFSDFPTEFMNKLIASLSPEELEELQKPIILGEPNLVDRDGNTDKTPCRRRQDFRNYQRVKATDGEEYFVVTNLTEHYQPVVHYSCDEVNGNDTYDNKCEPANPQKFAGYCCHQLKAKTTLQVIPDSTRFLETRNGYLFRKGTNVSYEVDKKMIIKKEVLMNSDCICDQYRSEIAYNNNYSCPSPESMFFL